VIEAVIISAVRTPIGRFLGKLSGYAAPELGAIAIRAATEHAGIPKEIIDEAYMGNVVSAGLGQAPARQAALNGGLPPTISAATINKVCGSGLQAVMIAASMIRAEDASVVVAGGMESMSNAPYYIHHIRNGVKSGNQKLIDAMIHDGLWDSFHNKHMGEFADETARRSAVTREDQDQFALHSHRKAIAAREKFKEEITPVEIKNKKGVTTEIMTIDEGPRDDATIESLAKLKPAFSKDGTVTAGNAPGVNDGAAALVVMSEGRARDLKLSPLARITAYATAGREPRDLFYAPVDAIRRVLAKLRFNDVNAFDVIEVNEAFSAQILANGKQLQWDWSKVNVNGGAVALGHPIGASGARILVTLLHELRRRKGKTGLASLCLGGGNAVALAVEMF
jgi:acetyl-CoA C-acetyltransferase